MYNAQVHVMYTVEIQDSKLNFTVLLFKGVILIRCSIIVIIESLKIVYKEFSKVLKNYRAIYRSKHLNRSFDLKQER